MINKRPIEDPSFLSGGGEMGALLRDHDWASTSLGEPQDWPPSLKIAVRIMLTSRQPIWVGWGQELTFFYNDAYKAIIGGKHPWALGRPIGEVWREIWAEISPMLATAMGGVEGTYVEEQLLIMERNGYSEETYYTFSYSPVPGDDGRPGGIICANTDDTLRVIGERQLALLRDLAASTADRRSWREVCSNAAAALAGNAHDLPFALLYMTDSDPDRLSLVGSAGIRPGHPMAPDTLPVRGLGPWHVDEVFRIHDIQLVEQAAGRIGPALPTGVWKEASSRAAVLSLVAGGAAGRRGVLIVGLNPFRLFDGGYRDFLKLVGGQVEAAVANADAFERARERAESLAALDRAKTNFFSNVSHEFRTPLTLMLGPLEESLEDARSLSPREQERVRVVHRNCMRLLKLVNSLLDFSRIEAGRSRAAFEPTDLAALTAELASNFRSATEKAGLGLTIDCPPLPEPVFVDRDMWEKIVLNLLSNAFKFTFEGCITVAVEALEGAVQLRVADTGTGIAAAELPRLFERFHRIEGAKGRSFEGSGIGLALVRELVDAHRGSIRAESVEGSGTTFYVTLPWGYAHLPAAQVRGSRLLTPTAAAAQAFVEEALRWLPDGGRPDSEPPHTGPDPASSPEPGFDGRPRVLLADDNADMRDYIARLLEPRHVCVAVGDGHAALEALRRERPDLVLTDIMMPGLDGFGLIQAIRADPQLRDLPVIVVSARAGEEASVEGLAAGADDYLAKPFSSRELMARVDGAIAMARMRREMGDALREREQHQVRLNQSLEIIVAARTAELESANAELRREAAEREKIEMTLRQSQKMEAIGKLTGGVAHDFNNLLQVIGGNLQLMVADVASNDRAEQRLRNALAGVSRGAKLASQLLAFGRRQPLAPKVVNLGRFIRGLDDLLRRALGDGIEIETVVSGGLWNTLVDPSQVENALLNLAINARDAMRGHGRLTIEAGNAALTDEYSALHDDVKPGQYVMLAVTDTGCGMTPTVLERVFEPFFTTKPEGQGTGLGLSMVYGFVKQSDGHIKIYSEPGHGTTIRLYLPRVQRAEDATEEVDAGPAIGGTETVLVVEDDEAVRRTVVDLLSELGYRVLKATDADSALAIIESGAAIDLLFTDVVMPGSLRSPELARQARLRLPDIAVLFTSGYTNNAIVHGGRLDQGLELLSKPYSREALARKIRHVLRNQRQRAVTAPHPQGSGTAAPGGQPAGRLRILVVEDDGLIRMVTTEMLQGLGHAVLEAADAAEALRVLADERVDLMLTDIGLPDMPGNRLAAEAVRAQSGLDVVFATGAGSEPVPPADTDARFTLSKPYDLAALESMLRRVCERRGVSDKNS